MEEHRFPAVDGRISGAHQPLDRTLVRLQIMAGAERRGKVTFAGPGPSNFQHGVGGKGEAMRNGAGLVCLGGLLLIGGTATARQAKTGDVPEGLVGSPAFAKKVKVTCPGLAVGELLDRLSAKTGVSLRADKATADDKMVLFCPARPLKDTLNDLAALFHDGWRHIRTADGEDRYILSRTSRATEYEQALSRATYAHFIAKLDEQVKALSETPEQLAKRPEDDPIRKSLASTGDGAATVVYAALSPNQRAALFDRRVLNFSAAEIGPQFADPSADSISMCPARCALSRRRGLACGGERAGLCATGDSVCPAQLRRQAELPRSMRTAILHDRIPLRERRDQWKLGAWPARQPVYPWADTAQRCFALRSIDDEGTGSSPPGSISFKSWRNRAGWLCWRTSTVAVP